MSPLLLLLLLSLLTLLSLPSLLYGQVFIDDTSSYLAHLPPGSTSGTFTTLTHPTSYSTDSPGSFTFTLLHHPDDAQDQVLFSLPFGTTLTPLNDDDLCTPSPPSSPYPGLVTFFTPFTVTSCSYTLSWTSPLSADVYVQYMGQAFSGRTKATATTRSFLTIFIHLTSSSSSLTSPPPPAVLSDATTSLTYPAPLSGSTTVVGAIDTHTAGSFTFTLLWSGGLTTDFALTLDPSLQATTAIEPAPSSASSPACQVGGGGGHHTAISLGYFSGVQECTYVVSYAQGASGALIVKVKSRPSDAMAYTGFLVYSLAVGNEPVDAAQGVVQ